MEGERTNRGFCSAGWVRAVLAVAGVAFGLVLVAGTVAAIVVPAQLLGQENARRARCMNQVRQIGLAMMQYAGDNDDAFMPLVDKDGKKVPAVDTEGKVNTTDPARSGFIVLLASKYLTTTKVFVCPSSRDKLSEKFDKAYADATDLTDAKQLADLVKLWGDDACSFGWDPTKKHSADAACAIVADKPPMPLPSEEKGDAKNNSPNHDGQGQNVFYNDGHVKWMKTPAPDAGDDPDFYLGGKGYQQSPMDAKIIR